MKLSLLALSALSLAVAAPAFAHDHGDHKEWTVEEKLAKYDTNKDGVLTGTEVGTAKWGKMEAADTNRDGKIDKAELTAWKEAKHDTHD